MITNYERRENDAKQKEKNFSKESQIIQKISRTLKPLARRNKEYFLCKKKYILAVAVFTKKMYTFHVVFRPEPEGGYTVLIPSLPGCLTWAPSVEEGKELIRDAIDVYMASVKKHKESIQDDSQTLTSSLTYA